MADRPCIGHFIRHIILLLSLHHRPLSGWLSSQLLSAIKTRFAHCSALPLHLIAHEKYFCYCFLQAIIPLILFLLKQFSFHFFSHLERQPWYSSASLSHPGNLSFYSPLWTTLKSNTVGHSDLCIVWINLMLPSAHAITLKFRMVTAQRGITETVY